MSIGYELSELCKWTEMFLGEFLTQDIIKKHTIEASPLRPINTFCSYIVVSVRGPEIANNYRIAISDGATMCHKNLRETVHMLASQINIELGPIHKLKQILNNI